MGCVKSVREAIVDVGGIHIIDLDLATGRFEFILLQGIDLSVVIELIPAKFSLITVEQQLAKIEALAYGQGCTARCGQIH